MGAVVRTYRRARQPLLFQPRGAAEHVDDPRPAKCQILYLRMKMLKLLQSSSGATPGFSDNSKGDHRHSGMGGPAFDDQALKRPKVGTSGRTAGSLVAPSDDGGLRMGSHGPSGAGG